MTLRAQLGSGLLGPRSLGLLCLSTTPEPGAGLGMAGAWQPESVCTPLANGWWREPGNKPKIVPATQTFQRHQCTPLCNNTNFVAAEKSIFPLERSSCGELLFWQPTAPRLRAPTPPRLVCSILPNQFAFSLTLSLGLAPRLPVAPLVFLIPKILGPGCVWKGGCNSISRSHLQS